MEWSLVGRRESIRVLEAEQPIIEGALFIVTQVANPQAAWLRAEVDQRLKAKLEHRHLSFVA